MFQPIIQPVKPATGPKKPPAKKYTADHPLVIRARRMAQEGHNNFRIARTMGIDSKQVHRWDKNGFLERG
jgi:hypothetical protein